MNKHKGNTKDLDDSINKETIFGDKVGFIARIFGCWHNRMSKPVTVENITYRYCPGCGVRRSYNLATYKDQGKYYYPAKNSDLYFV